VLLFGLALCLRFSPGEPIGHALLANGLSFEAVRSKSDLALQAGNCPKCGAQLPSVVGMPCGQCGFQKPKGIQQGLTIIVDPVFAKIFSPRWSPDSKLIAFTGVIPTTMEQSIYSISPEPGGTPRKLTKRSANGDTAGPVWGPDSGEIAYWANKGGKSGLEVMATKDRSSVELDLGTPIYSATFDWCPANGLIVFDSGTKTETDIFIETVRSKSPARLAGGKGENYGPRFSKEGDKVVFTSNRDGNYEIYSVNVDGTNLKRLTENQQIDSFPSWSPDSKTILFESNRTGKKKLYLMDANGSNQRQITFGDSNDTFGSWSPDGLRIAFLTQRGSQDVIAVLTIKR